ncbi:MAG: PRC-barrel domain-containing protein [Sphingomonadaceae bacterium]|nr:PRC-barrel domain-containing protein [Sphingomonadaceae bacterium]
MPVKAASAICGARVSGRDGTELGSITEIMLDTGTGVIAYCVMSHGGVLGVGEKLLAVPWSALNEADGGLAIDADEAQLSAAMGIDKDAWPPAAPRDWLA